MLTGLAGEAGMWLEDQHAVVKAGQSLLVPAHIKHGFRNVGEAQARHLVMVAPMRALEMVEELFRAGPERRAEVLAQHDSELVDP